MDLRFYNQSRAIRKTPKETYEDHKQAMVNSLWYNHTQTQFDVYEQSDIGTDTYNKIDVFVDSTIDTGTGFKKSNDFRNFTFRDLSKVATLGLMYKMDDNYWITINTYDNYNFGVRRCNNTLKWVDLHNGSIKELPCVIDYELSSPNAQRDKDIVVANGHCVVICQGNVDTLNIEKNQRFIFDGQPFRLLAINSLNHTSHYDNSTLLYLDLYLDTISESDDLIDNIANLTETVYEIDINEDITEQSQGSVGKISATVKLNGEPVIRDLVWTSDKNSIIDSDGNYTIVGDVGTSTKIEVCLDGNPNLKDTISIDIVETTSDNKEIIITPNVTEIRHKDSVVIQTYVTNNGAPQPNIVNVTSTDNGSHLEIIELADNRFELYCKQISNVPVIVTFESDGISKTLNIKLKSYF